GEAIAAGAVWAHDSAGVRRTRRSTPGRCQARMQRTKRLPRLGQHPDNRIAVFRFLQFFSVVGVIR
ncbi:MAG: hypothetical protein K9J85_03080, partial [Desulfobacteraceae bacterium]|nr:hypothetical protein [Desulfobacteraceae bacterium]